jgi:hypothetical protein
VSHGGHVMVLGPSLPVEPKQISFFIPELSIRSGAGIRFAASFSQPAGSAIFFQKLWHACPSKTGYPTAVKPKGFRQGAPDNGEPGEKRRPHEHAPPGMIRKFGSHFAQAIDQPVDGPFLFSTPDIQQPDRSEGGDYKSASSSQHGPGWPMRGIDSSFLIFALMPLFLRHVNSQSKNLGGDAFSEIKDADKWIVKGPEITERLREVAFSLF